MKSVSNKGSNGRHDDSRRSPNPEPSVLIVDDDPRVADVLQEFLEDEGFRVTYEVNGRTALNAIEKRQPDVVLVDMRMPVMDGVTLLREISNRWGEVSVIMMSATESPAGLEVPFIQKPFDLDEVVTTICQCQELEEPAS